MSECNAFFFFKWFDSNYFEQIWPISCVSSACCKNTFSLLDDLPKPKATELLEKGVESVQEYKASEERDEGRRWRVFRIGDQEHRVDMKAIELYKRVISHGGLPLYLWMFSQNPTRMKYPSQITDIKIFQVIMEMVWMPLLYLLCALCLKAINQTTDTSWTIYLS